jgi:hypothetical protein
MGAHDGVELNAAKKTMRSAHEAVSPAVVLPWSSIGTSERKNREFHEALD